MADAPPRPRVLQGRPASPGLAVGTVHRLSVARRMGRAPGAPEAEAAALAAALATALAELGALIDAEADPAAAEMLGFQRALLEDPALAQPAFAAIAAGRPADAAWHDAIEGEIALYRQGGDEVFAARAADLADLEARVAAHLAGGATDLRVPIGAVLLAEDLAPSVFLGTDWSAGGAVVLAAGSPTSHVAMLARARRVPMVVGLGEVARGLSGTVLVDGDAGSIETDPDDAARARAAARAAAARAGIAAADAAAAAPAVTACGTPIAMQVNLGDLAELDRIDPAICDGVGLTRTEFLFGAGPGLPDEEAQLAAYARILAWAGGRPVTIRTLDAGADKPIAGLTDAAESNPFLGVRGIRLSLARPDVFRVQLRALARAAAQGPLKVMLPMVALPAELEAARAMLAAEVAALTRAGIAAAMPPLGIMVEVPAAALDIARFDAAFFSIGSNDLTQYVMAAARDIGAVAPLNDVLHPPVLRLLAEVAAHGAQRGIEVSLCGDAGGDPRAIPALLGAGLRSLSASPSAIGAAKLAIAAVDLAGR